MNSNETPASRFDTLRAWIEAWDFIQAKRIVNTDLIDLTYFQDVLPIRPELEESRPIFFKKSSQSVDIIITNERKLLLLKIKIKIVIKNIEQIKDVDLIKYVDDFFKLRCRTNENICYNVTKILNDITCTRMYVYQHFIDELNNVI